MPSRLRRSTSMGIQWRETSIMRPRQGNRGRSTMCTEGALNPCASCSTSWRNVSIPRNTPTGVGAARRALLRGSHRADRIRLRARIGPLRPRGRNAAPGSLCEASLSSPLGRGIPVCERETPNQAGSGGLQTRLLVSLQRHAEASVNRQSARAGLDLRRLRHQVVGLSLRELKDWWNDRDDSSQENSNQGSQFLPLRGLSRAAVAITRSSSRSHRSRNNRRSRAHDDR